MENEKTIDFECTGKYYNNQNQYTANMPGSVGITDADTVLSLRISVQKESTAC